jgi:MtN3 and saliva related transmembrane protein
MTDILGIVAALLTTGAFVPQVIKTWKTRSARDLSIGWLVAFTTGVGCWVVYSVMLGIVPMIVGNAVTLALALTLCVLKLTDKSPDA